MATQEDERLLLMRWNPEELGRYEGQWIAFRGEVLGSHESLFALSEPYLNEINEGHGPLFAYVSFRVRG